MLRLELETDEITVLAPVEPDKPGNRTNDGRVDPAGGFWIGTMSRSGEPARPGRGLPLSRGADREALRRHHDPQLDLLLA